MPMTIMANFMQVAIVVLVALACHAFSTQACQIDGIEADCMGQRLLSVNRVVGNRRIVQVMNIAGNGIASLGLRDFDGFSNLKELLLSNNGLAVLPPGVFSGMPLMQLYLDHNLITSLPHGVVSGLSSLTHLYLHNNQINSIDDRAFEGLTALTDLSLNDNNLNVLPNQLFYNSRHIRKLFLGNSGLRTLGQALDSLTFLTYLNISDTAVDSLANLQMSHLQHLHLANTAITNLPCQGLCTRVQIHGNGKYCNGKSFTDFCGCQPKCSAHATCSPSHDCVCNTGYVGNGINCNDVDECNVTGDTVVCPVMSQCVNIPGSYQCNCKPGFGKLYEECFDINECTSGAHQCKVTTTTCQNTAGSYTCQCKTGHKRTNPFACQDIDECTSGTDQCDKTTTTCQNTVGGYTCQCKTGHKQISPLACQDIDECKSSVHQCNVPSTVCQNTLGSYSCPCNKGYSAPATQFRCTDVNECSGTTHLCNSTISQCENHPGTYNCKCKTGYTRTPGVGNHLKCQDVNECYPKSPCPQNAICINNDGSYYCNCDKDSYADGGKCTLVYNAVHNVKDTTHCIHEIFPGVPVYQINGLYKKDLQRSVHTVYYVRECSKRGADLLLFFNQFCIIQPFEVAFERNGQISRFLSENLNDQHLRTTINTLNGKPSVICQRPVQPCTGYGTLFVPKNSDFRTTMEFSRSKTVCKDSDGVLPTKSHGFTNCANIFKKRMVDLFYKGNTSIHIDLWTLDGNSQPVPGPRFRHTFCYKAGSKVKVDQFKGAYTFNFGYN